MLEITKFAFNPFQESTYVLIDKDTLEAAVVDPGMFQPEEFEAFDKLLADKGASLRQILNTHMHLDHCFGANYVKDKYGVPVAANLGDAPYAADLRKQAAKFGLNVDMPSVTIDAPLKDGDTVHVGNSTLQVIAVPGHTQGGLAFYCAAQNFVLTGDSLFQGNIGRTDLMGGNEAQLIKAIRQKLLTLPPNTTVLPGHGPFTTIADEKRHNPYV